MEYVTIRKSMKNMTVEKIIAINDPEIEKAVFLPKASRLAQKIFRFLQENTNLVTTAGGMEHYVTGLDRYKLVELARGYNINLFKYMFAVKLYEDGMLEIQSQNK